MNSIRVLWLSPWMRPLARVQVEALQRRGAEVLLVTSDQHPESDAAREYELVLDQRLRTVATWPASFTAWRRVGNFRPDIVVTELVRDPRWMALAAGTPRVQLLHDDGPHDACEHLPIYERALLDRWGARSTATITYSDYVAAAISARANAARSPVHVLPLTSDLDLGLVPSPVRAGGRRDFVMVGRLNPYKNIDVVLQAWQRHTTGNGWRGDNLVLIGDGPISLRGAALPRHVRWRSGTYRYSDVVETLAAAKGSVSHYRRASQSGVQVLSMQLGVMPIVSSVGGLPEYQPPDGPVVGVDDVTGLAEAFDTLADPAIAAHHGAEAARHYAEHFNADRAADLLLNVLADVLATHSPSGARELQSAGRRRERF